MLHQELTSKIIGAYYKVYNSLGYGFLEKVYENALKIELRRLNLKVEQQKNIKVVYEGFEVGDYFADLIVEDLVIIELKAAEAICEQHEAQLLNFGKEAKFVRKVFSNSNKKSAMIR